MNGRDFVRSSYIFDTANNTLRDHVMGNGIEIGEISSIDEMTDTQFFDACHFVFLPLL